MIDVRLSLRSLSPGFARLGKTWGVLHVLLRRPCDMDYVHLAELAPSQEWFKSYRAEDMTWDGDGSCWPPFW